MLTLRTCISPILVGLLMLHQSVFAQTVDRAGLRGAGNIHGMYAELTQVIVDTLAGPTQ